MVYNLLEEAVVEKFGADIWDDLLDDAGVAGAYTSLGNYSDGNIIHPEIRKLYSSQVSFLPLPRNSGRQRDDGLPIVAPDA